MKDIFVGFIKDKEGKPPVIMLHGDYQNYSSFYTLKNFFSEKGHPIVLTDLPGHGFSKAKEYNLSCLVRDIVSEMKLEKPAILGNSFGGLLAIDYAKKNETSSLILLNPPMFDMVKIYPGIDWEAKISEYEASSDNLFKEQSFIDYSKPTNLSDEELFAEGVKTTSPIGVRNNMKFYRFFHANHSININAPALLIVSKSDWMTPLKAAEEWIDRDKKKRRLESIEGAHNILIQDTSSVLKLIDKHYDFLFSDTA